MKNTKIRLLTTYSDEQEIPAVEKMINSDCKNFLEHVTLDADNCRIYSCIDSSNYRSFIYAFAYEIGQINPGWDIASQLQDNAKSLHRILRKKRILLSPLETEVLITACNFTTWDCHFPRARHDMATQYQVELLYEYGII